MKLATFQEQKEGISER